MKKLHFEITINAPAEKVRYTMIAQATYKQWTTAFDPAGSRFEGERATGKEIKFLGTDPEHPEKIAGMFSLVEHYKPFEFISLHHLGEIKDGVVVTDSVRKDAYENYTFQHQDGKTLLSIDTDTLEEYAEFMSSSWIQALELLKNLCEKKSEMLTVSTKIYAPLEQVRTKRTGPEHITQRNFASDDRHCPSASNDLRTGGMFSSKMAAKDGSFSFDFAGQYDFVEPMSRIEYTMGAFEKHFVPAGRRCIVTFVEDGSCGCVTVTETFDAEEVHDKEMQISGWQAILDNFKTYVEKGE